MRRSSGVLYIYEQFSPIFARRTTSTEYHWKSAKDLRQIYRRVFARRQGSNQPSYQSYIFFVKPLFDYYHTTDILFISIILTDRGPFVFKGNMTMMKIFVDSAVKREERKIRLARHSSKLSLHVRDS